MGWLSLEGTIYRAPTVLIMTMMMLLLLTIVDEIRKEKSNPVNDVDVDEDYNEDDNNCR